MQHGAQKSAGKFIRWKNTVAKKRGDAGRKVGQSNCFSDSLMGDGMELQPHRDQSEQWDEFDALLHHALLLDLEVSHDGNILKVGAVLGPATLG